MHDDQVALWGTSNRICGLGEAGAAALRWALWP